MYEFDDSRLEKLATMRDEGVAPYPHNLSVTHTATEAVAMMGDRDNDTLAEDETVVTVAGRLMFRNLMGKAGFARIQDRSGRVQIYVKKNIIGEEAFATFTEDGLGDEPSKGTFVGDADNKPLLPSHPTFSHVEFS